MVEKEFYIIGNKLYQIINGKPVEVRKLTYKDLARPKFQVILRRKSKWEIE